MTVLLRTTNNLPDSKNYDHWFSITGSKVSLCSEKMLPNLAVRLEQAFDSIAPIWWQIANTIGKTPSGEYSYALVCSPIASDFGLMLAWNQLALELTQEQPTTLIICDDPWLFRQIATLSNVKTGQKPPVWPLRMKGGLRGFVSRFQLAIRLSLTSLRLRTQRNTQVGSGAFILVYGHPKSTADGYDAYFGDLMCQMPTLNRLLHTDCQLGKVRELSLDGRTTSLHAWGDFWRPFQLLFVRWRPSHGDCAGEFGWLIRRAAVIEGSGGAHAMTAWTKHCLQNWIQKVHPERIAWPWENLPWERLLVKMTRHKGVKSLGYQHADVGPHQYNMSISSNSGGLDDIPDRIILNGNAYKDQLLRWGLPESRTVVGGAFRTAPVTNVKFDPEGPVFVALSGLLPVAREMLKAVSNAQKGGILFLIKEHPMYPIRFKNSHFMQRTDKSLSEIKSARAVLYGTGMSGLEGLLAGLPTYRLLLEDRICVNTLPEQYCGNSVTASDLVKILKNPETAERINWHDLFSPIDISIWQDILMPKNK